MANAQVVNVWQDAAGAHMAATVVETQTVNGVSGPVTVEYIGTVDLVTFAALPNPAAKKAALVAAVKAVRDASQPSSQAIAGITGTVTV